MSPLTEYYSAPGKLLITGEYLILEGAEGLALPLKFGQDLSVTKIESRDSHLYWKSYTPDGRWFKGEFLLPELKIVGASDISFANRLIEILKAVEVLNPEFLKQGNYRVKTMLDFNPEFGFGSSSTLLVNLARWANVNAFRLQELTFHGSGYDVAVALEGKPILYKLEKQKPIFNPIVFNPAFTDSIYFVYLGKKQRSLDAIKRFKKNANFTSTDLDSISAITRELIKCNSLQQFEGLLQEHETILSAILRTPPVQQQLFPDYKGGIVKSLGAWGGDFVLVTSQRDVTTFKEEMKQLKFPIIYSYKELVDCGL